MLVCGVALFCAAALVLRLMQGPMPVTDLLLRIADRKPGPHLALHRATLAWDHAAPDAPIILTLQDAVLTRPDGSVIAAAHLAGLGVLPAPLLAGSVQPVSLAIDGASAALLRSPGGIALDTGRDPAGNRKPAGTALDWRRLRSVDLRNAAATVTDRPFGVSWQVQAATIRLRDADGPGVSGQGALTLALGGQTSQISFALRAQPDGRRLTGAWTGIDPARLGIAALAAAPDLPIGGNLSLTLGPDWSPRAASLTLAAGPGQVSTGQVSTKQADTGQAGLGPAGTADGTLATGGGSATLVADFPSRHARLAALRLALPPGQDGSRPTLLATGDAHWSAGGADLTLGLDIDRVLFADLGKYWPAGLAKDARRWVVTNITGGAASALHADLGAALRHGAWTLGHATARAHATDVTLAWLRPVPPLTHATADLALLSPDVLLITLPEATQAASAPGAPLGVRNATLRISGLTARQQIGLVSCTLSGPVPQAVALLREPRLHLLAAHPIDLGIPSGAITADLTVSVPLDARVTIDQIAIHATTQISDLHLGGVIAGKDLDGGRIDLQADTNGLALTGTARLAGIEARLAAGMDFRAGPPGQTVTTYKADGRATIAQIEALGIRAGGVADGEIGYAVSVAEHRDGSGAASVHLDLRGSGLALGALGWRKSAATDATADADLRLDHDRLAGVDRLIVTGPELDIAAHGTYPPGATGTLVFDRIELGKTTASGDLRFPSDPASPLTARFHGATLDLAARLKADRGQPTPSRADAARAAQQRHASAAAAPPRRGRPWIADLAFDRVLLAPADPLVAVSAHAENDGLLISAAHVTGRAGAGRFVLDLAASGGARRLDIDTADAGALLGALDVTDAMRGGALSLAAQYDDAQPSHPLSGTATIRNFRIAGAPALARLLQAVTLYGLVDVLRGPGLAFSTLKAPFTYTDSVLTLNGARAYSASLGFTAKGDIDLVANRADLTGTIVPGYFFNTLPGKLPLIGRLFSPEKGGGVFAADYRLSGALDRPQVRINPLAALTPGFLRGMFGLGDAGADKARAPKPDSGP